MARFASATAKRPARLHCWELWKPDAASQSRLASGGACQKSGESCPSKTCTAGRNASARACRRSRSGRHSGNVTRAHRMSEA
eukprot:9483386-Pyramimonas_sp.AAC.1